MHLMGHAMLSSSRRFWIGAAGGLAGAFVMIFAMALAVLFAPSLGRGVFHEPVPLSLISRILARIGDLESIPAWVVAPALVIHLAYGALWAGLLALSTYRVTVWKGIVVGLGLWMVMLVFFLPMAGQRAFADATSAPMWIATFVSHVLYGATVGLLGLRASRRELTERYA